MRNKDDEPYTSGSIIGLSLFLRVSMYLVHFLPTSEEQESDPSGIVTGLPIYSAECIPIDIVLNTSLKKKSVTKNTSRLLSETNVRSLSFFC